MPNYIITSGAKYDPFTYSELAAPLISITNTRNELEDAYGELEAKASVWERLKDNPQDANVYNQYKKFTDDLRAQADALMREGLTPTSRRDLSKMKARYVAELNPIEEAWIKREADIKEYKDAIRKNPNLMYSSDPTQATIQSYMNGQTPTYTALDGNDLYKQGFTSGSALSNARVKEELPVLDKYKQYFEILEEKGYSPEEIKTWLSDSSMFPELNKAIEDVATRNNITAYGDTKKATSYIRSGMLDALSAGYSKKTERQRAYNNNTTTTNSNKILYDETGKGWKKIGEKLYQVDKDGKLKLDNNGMPIVFTNKPDKPSDSNPTNNTFNQMDYSKLKGDILIHGKDDKSIEYNLGTLLDPEKGNFKHIGTIAATVNNNIFDKDVLHDQLYSFNDNPKRELDYISNKKARETSSLIVDPNSGELKRYDNSNVTDDNSKITFKQLDGSALENRFIATGALRIEKSGNTNKYKVFINSSLGKLLESTAKSALAKGTGDEDSKYFILNEKEWNDFMHSNLLLLKAPNKRHGLNDEGDALSDILILQQQ